jgi:hypothetical protein
MFYFGAVSFSLANFIYYLACPILIRDFDTYSQYVDVGKGASCILDQFLTCSMVGIVLSPYGKHKCDLERFLRSFTTGDMWKTTDFADFRNPKGGDQRIDLGSEKEGSQIQIIPERFAEAFWFARNASDEWGKPVRYLCTFLYIVGYVLFVLVSIQGFKYVVQSM